MSEMERIGVILPARDIPEGSVVTKVTGTKKYTISSSVKFYGDERFPHVKTDGTVRFLLSEGDVNVVSQSLELKWEVSPQELVDYFRDAGVEIC
jgi:hypothetical protein